jgi:hypothetical protein
MRGMSTICDNLDGRDCVPADSEAPFGMVIGREFLVSFPWEYKPKGSSKILFPWCLQKKTAHGLP